MYLLLWRLLPYGLAGLGLILIIVGVGTMFGKVEEAPTTVAIASVPSATAKWLKITGGDGSVTSFTLSQSSKDDKDKKVDMHYVPLFTESQGQKYIDTDGHPFPPEKFVMVAISDEKWKSGVDKAIETGTKWEPDGTISDGESLDVDARNGLKEKKHADLNNIIVLNYGEHPLQKGEAVGMAGGGAGMGALGGLWSFFRWKKKPAVA